MATQVIELDLANGAEDIRVRDDVQHLFVFVTDRGVPIALRRMASPSSRTITRRELLPDVGPTFRSGITPIEDGASPTPMSIIVCTRERPDDLARCLESLAEARRDGHEVIVVDNAPVADRTAEVVARFGVRRIVEARQGLNRARNAGLAAAAHAIVAYLDDDVVVSRGWTAAIGRAFMEAAVGCVTGLVLPLELETEGQEQFELYSQHRRDLTAHVYSRETTAPSAAGIAGMGANMAFRKEVVVAVGGFDERLGPPSATRAADETDMFARLLDAGHRIAYAPAAYVWHRHRRTIAEVRSTVYGYGVGVFAMLTKRLVEEGDLGAVLTAGRWLVGPVVKRAGAWWWRRPAPRWDIVLAETTGALTGPWCFAYEATFGDKLR